MNSSTSTRAFLIIFLVTLACITLFSASSPLYPLNPWDDANCFMTIGKAMASGELVYRDIFDQKGPVLFFLHELAAIISYKSFLGVYLLEVLCYFGYLLYGYKTMRLFSDSWIILPLISLIGLYVVTTDFFFFGDSVEELCLPILSFTIYQMLYFLKTNKMPSHIALVILGCGMGVVFWMKFTIGVFHFGALLALLFICWRKNLFPELGQIILNIFYGFAAVSVATVLYFIVKGTFFDFIDAYFYTNLFRYGGGAANAEPHVWWFIFVKLVITTVLILPVILTKARWDYRVLIVSCYLLQLLSFTFFSVNIYYFLVIFAYAPLFIFYLRGWKKSMKVFVLFGLIALIATATSYNFVTLLNGTFPRSVLPMATYVEENRENGKDVLTFSSHETGIYQMTNQLPPNRYFFASNSTIPEIRDNQKNCILEMKPKFLVRKTDPVKKTLVYYDMPIPSNYRLVMQGTELFRYHFLLNPKMFLWNLGYTHGIMQGLGCEDAEQENLYLYERCKD